MIMPRGGARNRSGPQPDPQSGRSERRNYTLTALPSEGYQDDSPKFPLRGRGDDETRKFARREQQVWAEAWKTPQACAWSMEPWRWPVVAEYCRLKAAVEFDPTASAALVAQLHRYRDQIGLTPAGLRENGWAIAKDEVSQKRQERADQPEPETTPRARRLRG
ncbi:hypothetical protein GCM10009616_35880 [Microlunatus lacustris]